MNVERQVAEELLKVAKSLVGAPITDEPTRKYSDFVESEMKKIDPKLKVSLKKSGFYIKLRGRKPMGQKTADKLTAFFKKYPVILYGDWHSYKDPIQARETQLQIVPKASDSIGRHLGLN